MLTNAKGLSTLELMISILLGAVVLSIAGRTILELTQLWASVRLEEQDLNAALRVQETLRGVIRDLDASPLPIPPKIHQNGRLYLSDNSKNPVLGSRTAPDTNSDAVTSLELNLQAEFAIRSTKAASSETEIIACPRFPSPASLPDSQTFLGLGVDGMLLLIGDSVAAPTTGKGCRKFMLNQQPTMSGSPISQVTNPLRVRNLIPVVRHYTIYVDSDHQLRFLGHRGTKNIENQPIIGGVKQLKLSASTFTEGVFGLTARLTLESGREYQMLLPSLIRRDDPLNYIYLNY